MRPYWAALLLLAPAAEAAEDRARLEPISTASVAVVGDVLLGETAIEFTDGGRIELEAVPAETGGDAALRLFRLRQPQPLAPMPPNTICGRGQDVTFIAAAYPVDALDTPAWQRNEYRLAFYGGATPPAILALRQEAGGEGLCLWGAWTEVVAPGP